MHQHNPLRELAPVFLLLVIGALVFASDRGVVVVALGGLMAAIALLTVVVALAGHVAAKRRLARVSRLAELGATTGEQRAAVDTGAEAWLHAGVILAADRGKYREQVRDTPSLLTAADGDDVVAGACRAVVLKHLQWSKEAARKVWQLRERVEGDVETAAWLEWFVEGQSGWPELSDSVAQAGTWALPRLPEPIRRPLLRRALRHAKDDPTWAVFRDVLRPDIERLEAEPAAP